MTGIAVAAFTAVEGYNGFVVFTWIYGVFAGGYNYSLKMYIYEKVRARNFARAWGFAQFAMAVPNFLGPPITGGNKSVLYSFEVYSRDYLRYTANIPSRSLFQTLALRGNQYLLGLSR